MILLKIADINDRVLVKENATQTNCSQLLLDWNLLLIWKYEEHIFLDVSSASFIVFCKLGKNIHTQHELSCTRVPKTKSGAKIQ